MIFDSLPSMLCLAEDSPFISHQRDVFIPLICHGSFSLRPQIWPAKSIQPLIQTEVSYQQLCCIVRSVRGHPFFTSLAQAHFGNLLATRETSLMPKIGRLVRLLLLPNPRFLAEQSCASPRMIQSIIGCSIEDRANRPPSRVADHSRASTAATILGKTCS